MTNRINLLLTQFIGRSWNFLFHLLHQPSSRPLFFCRVEENDLLARVCIWLLLLLYCSFVKSQGFQALCGHCPLSLCVSHHQVVSVNHNRLGSSLIDLFVLFDALVCALQDGSGVSVEFDLELPGGRREGGRTRDCEVFTWKGVLVQSRGTPLTMNTNATA